MYFPVRTPIGAIAGMSGYGSPGVPGALSAARVGLAHSTPRRTTRTRAFMQVTPRGCARQTTTELKESSHALDPRALLVGARAARRARDRVRSRCAGMARAHTRTSRDLLR